MQLDPFTLCKMNKKTVATVLSPKRGNTIHVPSYFKILSLPPARTPFPIAMLYVICFIVAIDSYMLNGSPTCVSSNLSVDAL